MDLDPTTIFLSIIFGVIGMGYFSYGKKQNPFFMVTGILLMVFPYFTSNIAAICGIGVLLLVLPFILTKLG